MSSESVAFIYILYEAEIGKKYQGLELAGFFIWVEEQFW